MDDDRDDDRLDESLDALSKLLLTDEPLDDALRRVAALAIVTVASCERADVTLVAGERGARRDESRTDPDGPGLDQVQLGLGDGPIFEAMHTGRPVRIDSVRDESRWPEFAERAAGMETMSCLVVPLTLHGEPIGALNLYSSDERSFDDGSERVGEMFAAQAAVVLANAKLHQACVDLTGQLEQALASRAVIDQAKGILMERLGGNADDAFEELRRRSQAENRKVRDLARELVASAGPG